MVTNGLSDDIRSFFVVLIPFVFLFLLINTILATSDYYRLPTEKTLVPNRLYIVIKRPKNTLDYIISLFGSPVSSISFCNGSDWLKFTKEAGCIIEGNLNDRSGYSFIYTGIDLDEQANKDFYGYLGTRWPFSGNCVTVWDKFTDGTHLEPKPWEWLPTFYMQRISTYFQKDIDIQNQP